MLIHKDQRGFTLIEMAIAVAVAGLITGGITMTIFQIFDGNTRSSNHMLAVRQVQNAGYWVSQDTQMAQSVITTDPGRLLTLTWTDWETGTVHQVDYTIVGSELRRNYDGEEMLVAQYIDPNPTNTNCQFASGELVFTVTATVGTASETRTYEVKPRPSG